MLAGIFAISSLAVHSHEIYTGRACYVGDNDFQRSEIANGVLKGGLLNVPKLFESCPRAIRRGYCFIPLHDSHEAVARFSTIPWHERTTGNSFLMCLDKS